MEHYKIRNSVLYNKRIFSKSSKWQIIVGCILALIISLCVATFIGFFQENYNSFINSSNYIARPPIINTYFSTVCKGL